MIRVPKRSVLSICALCTLGLGLGEWASRSLGGRPSSSAPEGRGRIVASLNGLRPFEARFTGGFTAGPIAALPPDAEDRLRRMAGRSMAGNLADHALLRALAGDVDSAVTLLAEATLREPANAAIRADLAAAYLIRGEKALHPLDDLSALVAAQDALALDPGLVEARCSRALALARLHLPAREAWEHCLEVEPDRAWREEIESRARGANLQEVSRTSAVSELLHAALEGEGDDLARLVADNPRSAQRYVEEVSLPTWASARAQGSEAIAASALEVSHRIASVLAAGSRDALLQDAVRGIGEAEDGKGRNLEVLLRAHAAYRRGRELFQSGAYTAAAGEFTEALREFVCVGSPFALRTELYLAYAEKPLSGPRLAVQRISGTVQRARAQGYPILAGEGLRLLGLCRLDAGEPALAQEAYQQALLELTLAGDSENLARTQNLLAELLGYQGEMETAWTYWRQAARIARDLDDPEVLYQVYSVASMSAFRWGQPQAAAIFQDEVVRNAQRLTNPLARTSSLVWQARYRNRLGEKSGAGRALWEARREAMQIPDSSARVQAGIGLSLAKAELDLEDAPERSVESLTEALALARSSGSLFFQIDAHLLRARAYLAREQVGTAEEDLEQGIRLASEWRQRTRASAQKIAFQDQQRALFDEMLRLQLDQRQDPVRALDVLERERAQALLDRFSEISDDGRSESKVMAVVEVERLLPARTVVLSYAPVGTRLGIWVSGARGTRFMPADLELSHLLEAVRVLQRPGSAPEASKLAAELLYEKLVQPIENLFPKQASLVICASGELQQIPWAALRNRRTGRFLLEDFTPIVAPSISVYLNCLERSRRHARRTAEVRVLAVGDPAFAREEFPSLKRILAAGTEAERIAAMYPGSLLLLGERATREELLKELGNVDILHLATHAEENRRMPGLSRLVLAAEPGSSEKGVLTAGEISRFHLPRLELVVLSACRTVRGRVSLSEGNQSMARAFLAAGAPTVVATLWRVDDAESAELISDFFRRLRAGENAASALRSAQLSALRKADPPRGPKSTWAAFQLVGGVDTDNH